MKLVYVAGPYRSKHGRIGVVLNILRARRIARELWRLGLAVLCPHTNTALLDGAVSDDAFLAGDIEMLARCDGIVMAPGWERSAGSLDELTFARGHAIAVFFWTGTTDARLMLEHFARTPKTPSEITVQQAAAVMGRHAAALRHGRRLRQSPKALESICLLDGAERSGCE